jgi:hypothetical protein
MPALRARPGRQGSSHHKILQGDVQHGGNPPSEIEPDALPAPYSPQGAAPAADRTSDGDPVPGPRPEVVQGRQDVSLLFLRHGRERAAHQTTAPKLGSIPNSCIAWTRQEEVVAEDLQDLVHLGGVLPRPHRRAELALDGGERRLHVAALVVGGHPPSPPLPHAVMCSLRSTDRSSDIGRRRCRWTQRIAAVVRHPRALKRSGAQACSAAGEEVPSGRRPRPGGTSSPPPHARVNGAQPLRRSRVYPPLLCDKLRISSLRNPAGSVLFTL